MDLSKLTNFIKSNLAINRIDLAKGVASRALKEGEEGFAMMSKSNNKRLLHAQRERMHLERVVNGTAKTGQDGVRELIHANTSKLEGRDMLSSSSSRTQTVKNAFVDSRAEALTYGQMAKEYFWDGANNTQRAMRIGTAAGGYLGANAVLRGATGGSIVRNSTGESDLMGIPLI